mmetsp:Transcript_2123/g.3259  ORF Transcript_2123/g.3259 Transcript_2123/m.3259 type:complete len:843 (+) Transcript_2123:59-2587(+)
MEFSMTSSLERMCGKAEKELKVSSLVKGKEADILYGTCGLICGILLCYLTVGKPGAAMQEIGTAFLAGGMSTLLGTTLTLVYVRQPCRSSRRTRTSPFVPVGTIMLGRIYNAKSNWKEHSVRSFIEVAVWLHIMFGTYYATSSIATGALVSTMCSVFIVTCGEKWSESLAVVQQSILRSQSSSCFSSSCSSCEKSCMSVDTIISFLSLFLAVSLGGANHFIAQRADYFMAIFVTMCSGMMFLSAAHFFFRVPKTRFVGITIENRVRNTHKNWLEHPIRSAIKTAVFLAFILLSYYYCNDILLSSSIGCVGGILTCLLSESLILISCKKKKKKSETQQAASTKKGASKLLWRGDIDWCEFTKHRSKADCWLCIAGNVYDVTKWLDRHPGGRQILLNYCGRDATDQFLAFHRQEDHRYLKLYQIGRVAPGTAPEPSKQTVAYRKLRGDLQREGLFDADLKFYIKELLIVLALLGGGIGVIASIGAVSHFTKVTIGAVLLGLGMHQAAFIGHDGLHRGITVKGAGKLFGIRDWGWKINKFLGVFCSSCIFGISSSMWTEEHSLHHSITRRPREDPQFIYLPIWLISLKELHKSVTERVGALASLEKYFMKILVPLQIYTFVPVAVLIGRTNLHIISACYAIKNFKVHDLLCQFLYWLWFVKVILAIPLLRHRVWFVFINHCVIGVLHVQLVLNHFAVECFTAEEEEGKTITRDGRGVMPWDHQQPHPTSTDPSKNGDDGGKISGDDGEAKSIGFVDLQIRTTRNIEDTWYNGWFQGGLQYQLEHHLFPMLPRHNLAVIQNRVRELCEQHGFEYKIGGVFETLALIQQDFQSNIAFFKTMLVPMDI